MAICLPGMASRVKRAATSDIRVAPLVMTTNCTTIRMRKMMPPTIGVIARDEAGERHR